MPLLIVLALFITVPLAELYLIINVGQEIGALPTIAILIADSILGSLLLRWQGRSAWRRFNEALAAGRPPAREVADGGLIILGGALLLTPGFLTDALGLILLIPPTRALVRGFVVRRIAGGIGRRVVVGYAAGQASGQGPVRPRHPGAGPDGDVVDGTAVDLDQPQIHP